MERPAARPRPGSTFKAPITLNLYRYSKSNPATGEIKPGRLITSVTKTFSIRYRPSSQRAGESRYMGRDHALHNGIAQTISFPVNRNLANDVVWTVGYNTNTSGLHPLGHSAPDGQPERRTVARRAARSRSLPRLDHLGYPGRARFAGGAPFVAGELNLDSHGWAGYVPAARFTVR